MNYTTTWTLNISDKISAPLNVINEKGKKTAEAVGNSFANVSDKLNTATDKARKFGDCLRQVRAIDWMAASQGVNSFFQIFSNAAQVGENYERALLDVSAITGITGKELDNLGNKARNLAKEFGGAATDNLATFQTILSRLGPQIGNSDEAMERMGRYANTLAKTMGGDVKGATDALTTSMLQFKVNLNDPIEASKEMERMMNVVAAGAQEGAAEVTQVSQSLVQAGGMAKLANVSFEETNSAIQALAQAGKYGSEAGVGLRNVLIKMNAPSALSKEATSILANYGVNMKKVSDAATPFAERLKELQKIGKSTDALASVFGAENVQAAQALINSAQYQEELTQKITGTNVAYEQAQTVMEGWGEKISRLKARFEDFQIAGFNVYKVLGTIGSGVGSAVSVAGDLGAAYSGLAPVLKSTATWFRATAMGQKLASLWTGIMTAKQWLLNAAMTANPVGLIVAAIVALVAIVVVAINKYDEWGAALLSFLGPVGIVINAFKSLYDHWESIKRAFQTGGILAALKRIGIVLLDAVLKPMQQLLELASNVPGLGHLAGKGASKIEEMRKKMNLIITGEVEAKKEKKKTQNTKAVSNIPPATTGGVSIDTFLGGSGEPLSSKKNGKKGRKSGNGSSDNDGMSLSGSKGNRTMNVTVTVNNHFSGNTRADNISNKVAGQIVDRLRDGLIALD
ncbi:phage tail tape measure protein [Riemerella anatipestifer]|nr:phage tail tape measure protein [Riemerella anatipestifer]MDY3356854.1 phage tail tape measure protein [Riemerella anatipestifer]